MVETAKPDLVRAQQEYIDRGLVVFPLQLGVRRNKEGALKKQVHPPNQFQLFDTTTVPRVNKSHNALGLSCGTNSGIFAIDVDDPKVWAQFLADNQLEEPKTWKQKSASQGFHLIFKLSAQLEVFKGSANSLGPRYPGIDTRTTGNFLFLTPTTHETADVHWSYRWVDGQGPEDIPLSEMPSSIIKHLLLPGKRGGGNKVPSPTGGVATHKTKAPKPTTNPAGSFNGHRPSEMIKKWHAVFVGRQTGIVYGWKRCQRLVDGFPAAHHKSFLSRVEAAKAYQEYIDGVGQQSKEGTEGSVKSKVLQK